MLLASKYEEIYAPEIRDFVYMTDNAYSKDQILAMERDILMNLSFELLAPSPYRFL
jgi:cyclin B